MVVFLTGLVQLPPDVAACIFFSLPDPSAPPTWHYLGHLTNAKPSAIYRLTNLTQAKQRTANGLPAPANGLAFDYNQEPVLHVAQVGISVEPIAHVNQMVPVAETAASKANAFAEFINKTVSNLYNYCSSFSRPASELANSSPFQTGSALNGVHYVPISTIQTWYENYTRRLSNDQNFWKTLN